MVKISKQIITTRTLKSERHFKVPGLEEVMAYKYVDDDGNESGEVHVPNLPLFIPTNHACWLSRAIMAAALWLTGEPFEDMLVKIISGGAGDASGPDNTGEE